MRRFDDINDSQHWRRRKVNSTSLFSVSLLFFLLFNFNFRLDDKPWRVVTVVVAAAAAVVDGGLDKVDWESLLARVKLTDGCWGFVVNLPMLLDKDVKAQDVQDVSLAIPVSLLELTSFSKYRSNENFVRFHCENSTQSLFYPFRSLIRVFLKLFLIFSEKHESF